MSLSLSAPAAPLSTSMRWLLFGLAAAMGGLFGYGWSLELSDLVYDALLRAFLDPGFQVAGLGMAVALGFSLGFAHIFRVCYLPAVLAVLPLVQAARDRREWLRTAALLMLGMVLVSALWGAIVGAPGAVLAGTVGNRRTMGLIMQTTLLVTGLLMLVVALGELGLIRRLLPEIHLPEAAARRAAGLAGSSPSRRVLLLGLIMGASFGIVCNRPLYLVLLAYVALVGSMAYGVLVLGAYGLGLSSSIVLAGLVLIPAGRSRRLVAWLEGRQEAFHLVQGLAFAGMGALSVSWFVLRFVPPPS